jgi:murein DD-endopeptidase MepM/ murein hydrolase activator NlpD
LTFKVFIDKITLNDGPSLIIFVKKTGVNILIALVKLVIILKRLAAAFFVAIIIKPISFIFKFVFYKLIIKLYSQYLSLVKRSGLKKFGNLAWLELINRKLSHIIIIGLTIILVFTNLVSRTKASAGSFNPNDTILSSVIGSEFGNLEQGGELIEEFALQDPQLSAENAHYLDNYAVAKNNIPQIIEEEENVATPTQNNQTNSNNNSTPIKKRTEIETYTVAKGDTISTIARKFGLKVNTILNSNNLSAYSLIRPGDTLQILTDDGVMHKVNSGENLSYIAKRYGVEESVIIAKNNLTNANSLKIGQKLLIPGATGVVTRTVASNNNYTGISAIKNLVKPASAKAETNKMNWPTVGHTITQYYSWRHTGLDIANKTGTPLYAADAGTVEFAGWSTGYGNNVLINHGGGKKTRYAHASKLYVKKGDSVAKGETIAAMGSTGWSTGPHIHFEVIINGVKYNPLNYIK